MEPFKLGSKVKQLPCKHIYHKKCISIWFAEHNKWYGKPNKKKIFFCSSLFYHTYNKS